MFPMPASLIKHSSLFEARREVVVAGRKLQRQWMEQDVAWPVSHLPHLR